MMQVVKKDEPTDIEKKVEDEKLVSVNVDESMAKIISITSETLGVEQHKAITKLCEIGIVNILNYPTGNKLLDNVMKENKFPSLIRKIKDIWGYK